MADLARALRDAAAKAKRFMAKNGQVGEENTKAVLIEPLFSHFSVNFF